MAANITGQGVLAGLQHATQNGILGFFNTFAANFGSGTITLLSYMKTSAVVMGVTIPSITVAYQISGAGFGAVSGSGSFVVPGPEAGTGLSFLVAAAAIGMFAYFKQKRGPAH